MSRKLSTADFVKKAQTIHGDRYDYSESNYVGNKAKLKIICKEHGEFWQTPGNHTQGFGCLKCGLGNAGQYHKKDTFQFIQEARAKHGPIYDYSQTVYKGAREKLKIICSKHGDFLQTAHVHLRSEAGLACLACSYEARAKHATMSVGEFIERAVKVHGEAYDYSRVSNEFRNSLEKVEIVCPIHGAFLQSPSNHLSGKGCKKCSTERIAKILVKSTVDFVKDAQLVHGTRYDYSETNYSGAFAPVKIKCPVDGIFEQFPTSHLGGIGCPKCSRRNQGAPRNLTRALRGDFDDGKDSYVYQVAFDLENLNQRLYKVGSGTGSRQKSVLNSIRKIGGSNVDIKMFSFSSTGEAIVFEHLAHEQIAHSQFVLPPESKFPGYSEVFSSPPDFSKIADHPTLALFRLGERWTERE